MPSNGQANINRTHKHREREGDSYTYFLSVAHITAALICGSTWIELESTQSLKLTLTVGIEINSGVFTLQCESQWYQSEERGPNSSHYHPTSVLVELRYSWSIPVICPLLLSHNYSSSVDRNSASAGNNLWWDCREYNNKPFLWKHIPLGLEETQTCRIPCKTFMSAALLEGWKR